MWYTPYVSGIPRYSTLQKVALMCILHVLHGRDHYCDYIWFLSYGTEGTHTNDVNNIPLIWKKPRGFNIINQYNDTVLPV